MFKLSSLVWEASQGRAERLNRLFAENSPEHDVLICTIWKILILFISDEERESSAQPIHDGLCFQNDRFYFSDAKDHTYSKSSLKKYVFQILRRLFEACSAEDLPLKPWLLECPVNLLHCIRVLSSDFSVVMYLLNGLDMDAGIGKSLPKGALMDIRSIMQDFAMKNPSTKVLGDMSLANITCMFILKFFYFLHDFKVTFELLLNNAEKTPENNMPFIKTLNRYCSLLHKQAKETFYKSQTCFNRVAKKLSQILPKNLQNGLFGKDQISFFILYYKYIQMEPQHFIKIFHGLPVNLEQDLNEELLELFFYMYSDIPFDHEAIQWVSQVHSVDCVKNQTEFILFACSRFAERKCPGVFIENYMDRNINWKEVVVSPFFIHFVQQNILIKTPSKTSLKNIARVFDWPLLLEASVKAGLLNCFPMENAPISYAISDFLLRAVFYESNETIIRWVLIACIPLSELVWSKWPAEFLRKFFQSMLRFFSYDLLNTLLDKVLPYFENALVVLILLQSVDKQTGLHLLKHGNLYIRGVNASQIPWLQIDAEDSTDIRLAKMIVQKNVDFKEAIIYAMSSSRSFFVCQKLLMEGGILSRIKTRLEAQYDRLHSPVYEYYSTLQSPCLRRPRRKTSTLLRDFFLMPVLKRSKSLIDPPDFYELPMSLLFRDHFLFSIFLELVFSQESLPAFPENHAQKIAEMAEGVFPSVAHYSADNDDLDGIITNEYEDDEYENQYEYTGPYDVFEVNY